MNDFEKRFVACHEAMLRYVSDYMKLGITTHLCVEHKLEKMCESSDRIANRIATEDLPDLKKECGVKIPLEY